MTETKRAKIYLFCQIRFGVTDMAQALCFVSFLRILCHEMMEIW